MSLGLPLRRSPDLPFAVVCALLFAAVGATGSGGHETDAAGSGSVQLVAAGSVGILADEGREEKQPRWGIRDHVLRRASLRWIRWRGATCSRPPVPAREVETETEAVEKSVRVEDLERRWWAATTMDMRAKSGEEQSDGREKQMRWG
uniref:DUF834 domain-containing protein n=1 Tax=Oryza meridionalis TaxID=40149 RepID=A0A0E0F9V7_9ORYZ